jgi:CheY-like chemotaxis protein
MKILILDEDTDSGIMRAFCERLESMGESTKQVTTWEGLKEAVDEFKPDALLIDLMIPPLGLLESDCGGGYTTGAHIYRTFLRPLLPNIPFCVFTAADTRTARISKAIDQLKILPEYRGTIEKGEDVEVILGALTGPPR